MGDFPYTDVEIHYPAGPLAGDLIDVEPLNLNLIEQGTVGLKAGDGSPPGNGDARGPVDSLGSKDFRRALLLDGQGFDIRGATSMTILGWMRMNELTARPQYFSILDAAGPANKQAFSLYARQPAAGGAFNVVFRMFDGLTFNNFLAVKASSVAEMTSGVWHLIGGSWDSGSNLMSAFWGDGGDATGQTFYYNTAAGFSAGFSFIGGQIVNVGRYSDLNTPDMDVDHISFWNGRAFNLNDFLKHWQLGTGLARSEFAVNPGRDGVAAPTNLVVAPVGVDQLDLSWDDNSPNEDEFRAERSASGGGPFVEIGTSPANTPSFSDTPLAPGTTRFYRVRAFVAPDVFSNYSNVASGTTGTVESPTNLVVTPVGIDRLDLTWNTTTGEDTYRVERSESQTGPFVEIATVAADITFFSDTPLSPGATRFYRVRAEQSGVFSNYTSIESGTTDDIPPPPPTDLVKSDLTATSVVLSWNLNSSDETAVEVHRAPDDSAGPYSIIAVLPAGATTHTDDTIGSVFFYKVRVLNQFGASGFSNIVGLTTPPVPGEQPEPVPCDPPAQSTPFFNDLMPETSFRIMNQAIEDWLTGMRFRDMFPQTVDNALISRDYSQTHEVTPGFPVNQTSPFPKLTYHMTGLVPDRTRWQPNPVVNLGPRPQRWMPCNKDSAPAVGADVFEISNRAYATADQKSIYLLPWPIPFNLTYQIDLWTKTGQDMLFLRSAILARFTHVDETYLKATFPGYGRQLLRLSLDRWDDTSSIETGEEERELRNTLTITLYGWLFRVPTLKKTIENAHVVTIDGSPPDDGNLEDGSEFLQFYNDPANYTFSADGSQLLSVAESPVFTPPNRVMFWVSASSDGITVGP